MIIGGRHVGIPVSNLNKSLEFYEGALGFKQVVNEVEEGSFIETILNLVPARVHIVKMVLRDSWMLELLHYLGPERLPRPNPKVNDVGFAHIALTVDSLDEEYRRLSDMGIRFSSKPQFSPNGYAKVCFCQDPDGNYVELVEVLKKP